MLDQILAFIMTLFDFWKKVPQNIKDRIIALLVEMWDEFFRKFYRRSRQEEAA